ncbi:transketolase family protein [Dubosiella muris]|uniref:Transketolase family protein n=1 Tax=Dubosiella muris TaxID=3038133 RepID=A0AC61RC03_9FIRM|nr:transketolase C-terminal domain-containing protein [Dubosiella muris]TGY67305.1 transketolase family protein [Dubosiella muris]
MAKIATRVAYGDALKQLMAEDRNIVALDADLAGSTKGAEAKKIAPERHFDMGIAEGNMMAVAAGLAASGKIAFASTFAMFATGRAYEQIRNSIVYPALNVKVCASHAGVSVGEDGASHQCIEDVSLMRTIPGMRVIVPCDYNEALQAIKYIAYQDGPFYVRLGRSGVEQVNDENYVFTFGKGVVLKEGDPNSRIALIGSGSSVQECLKAYDMLDVKPKVVNMHTISPIDAGMIEELKKTCDTIITVEDHLITGGLGSAVAEVMASAEGGARLVRLGVPNVFGESGKPDELYHKFGFDAEAIKNAVENA